MAIAVVDETGDPGTGGRGTPWFCWVGVVVPDEHVAAMITARKQLAGVSPRNWSDGRLAGDDLIGALTFMNTIPDWQWVAVLSDTRRTTRETSAYIHDPTKHRFYTMLIMLERLSWVGEAYNEKVSVFLERPNDTYFTERALRSRHEAGLPKSWANYEYLPPDNIHLVSPAKMPLLSCAHMVACAVGKAVNAHPVWRRVIPEVVFPEYLRLIESRVWLGPWRGAGLNLTDRGFTLLPARHRRQIRAEIPFLEEWLERLGLTT
jgi:hypothetical protein